MKNLDSLINDAAAGDNRAFADIIRMFQDMAYGYAYTLLGDFHLAQDAAQEAFIEAYYNLKRLEKAGAFPGWFRRIIQFRCNRYLRRKQLPQVPLTDAFNYVASVDPGPYELVERKEMKDSILNAINNLNQPLREVTTLFYINGYSQNDISDFLEIPVSTVKNRLSTSRNLLQRSMGGIIKETFGGNRLPDDFAKKIIDDVPSPFNDLAGSRLSSFPACLCSCLEIIGENYGISNEKGPWNLRNSGYHINHLYTLLMGATGSAFCFNWDSNTWHWKYNNPVMMRWFSYVCESFKRAFEAVGYEFEIIGNKNPKDSNLCEKTVDYDYFKERIIGSIRDRKRPLLALGVVSFIPECCIITGYDESADVLIGWSHLHDFPQHMDSKMEFEPCGYFRQKNWFRNTYYIMLIGDKHEKPPMRETHRKALEWAVALFRGSEIIIKRECGMTAFQAFADMILNDEDFRAYSTHTINSENDLFNATSFAFYNKRIPILKVMALTFYEARGYAVLFLRQIAESIHELKDELNKAISLYESVIDICEQIYKLLYKGKTNEETVRAFMYIENHRIISEKILQIRDCEAEAVGIFDKILGKLQ